MMTNKVPLPNVNGTLDQRLAYPPVDRQPENNGAGEHIVLLHEAFIEAAQYVRSQDQGIEMRADFFSGKPKLRGRRLAVYDVLYSLADTLSVEGTCEDLSGLAPEEVRSALLFVARVCE